MYNIGEQYRKCQAPLCDLIELLWALNIRDHDFDVNDNTWEDYILTVGHIDKDMWDQHIKHVIDSLRAWNRT